jgi:hypothetical protein
MITIILGIYLAINLFLLGLGFTQMLRHASRAHQVLAVTLLWPWMAFRSILRNGWWIVRNCKIIISDFGCCSERGRHMIPSRAQVYSGDALETRMAYNNRPVILSEATVYAK